MSKKHALLLLPGYQDKYWTKYKENNKENVNSLYNSRI